MRKRFPLLLCFLALSTLALVACGGGGGDDEDEVKEAIEVSATSTDPADCKRFETQGFMEQASLESGKAAVRECEEEAEKEEGADSVEVSSVEVDGSNATADAKLIGGGGFEGQTVEIALVKDGDHWKLDEVAKFTEFNQEKLVKVFERELAENPGEISASFADCFVRALQSESKAEIEELLISGSPRPLEELSETCESGSSA